MGTTSGSASTGRIAASARSGPPGCAWRPKVGEKSSLFFLVLERLFGFGHERTFEPERSQEPLAAGSGVFIQVRIICAAIDRLLSRSRAYRQDVRVSIDWPNCGKRSAGSVGLRVETESSRESSLFFRHRCTLAPTSKLSRACMGR